MGIGTGRGDVWILEAPHATGSPVNFTAYRLYSKNTA